MTWLWLLACLGGDVLPALAPPQADVTAVVVDANVESGAPVMVEIQSLAAEGWVVEPGIPYAEGLEAALVAEEGPVHVNGRDVHTWKYALTGPDGSYVVGVSEGKGTGPAAQERTFEPPPLFVDIGVEGPSGGPMAGFAEAPPPQPPPYRWMAVAAAITLLVLALVWGVRRWLQGRERAIPPPIPPHIIAQGAWSDARAQIKDDHPLAVRLSMVLREYVEARSGVPATKGTTNEILQHLEQHGFDGERFDIEARMRVQRILDATDRLKFAREGGGEAFFTALDADFEGIINATRPQVPLPGDSNA